jgi:hypothetical protein
MHNKNSVNPKIPAFLLRNCTERHGECYQTNFILLRLTWLLLLIQPQASCRYLLPT